MKNNVNSIDNKLCIGCGVCSTSCPVKCISIKENEIGFYNPEIDEEKCVDCSICQSVCYKFFKEEDGWSINDSKGYLSYSNNEYNVKNSSSGGIGRELAYKGLDSGYLICGVEYDYENNNVKHVIVDNKDDVDKISGSKYIPSFTEEAFSKIEKDKKYIIFGTPCQMYGLRKYMQKYKLNNIILVDFFCHGTPSLKIWQKYLGYLKDTEGINEIKKVNFRDKTYGWHNFSMKIESSQGEYIKNLNEDKFFDFFLKNLCLMDACPTCKLRFNKIYSDIRLGDFWGPKCEKNTTGVSIILTNTKVGDEFFKNLKGTHIEAITFEEIKQSQYVEHLDIPKQRKNVIKGIKEDKEFNELYKQVTILKYKVKIKTLATLPIRIVKKVIRSI